MELYIRNATQLTDSAERAEVQKDLETPGHYTVHLGGKTYEVHSVTTATSRSLVIDGMQFDVACHWEGREAHGGSRFAVGWERSEEVVEVLEPLAYEALLAESEVGGGGSQKVTAYMPGKVVSILVEAGSEVAAGQGILVLEAMKMENEIQAETAGILAEIFVEEGQAVQGGDPLFEVVAAADPA
jgi:biotin carboxyl carrier protein